MVCAPRPTDEKQVISMGKAERNRRQSAKEKIAAQQAASRRAEARRRTFIAGGSVLTVLAIVVVLVIIKAAGHSAAAPVAKARADAAVARQLTNVPASVLNAVGAGPSGQTGVTSLGRLPAKLAPLTSGGKPEVLYVGAEYCPFCAAERWGMVVALSRFGTFSGLHFIRSSPTDVYSNTATLTFYRSHYISKYLTFVPVEETTVTQAPLQKATAAQTALFTTYGGGSFPFVDFGNRFVANRAQYLPSTLGSLPTANSTHFGLNWAQIARDLQTPSNPVAQRVLGTANHITAAICQLTHGQPGSVCSSAAVTSMGGNF